jgi:hypothetical protein
VIFHMLSLYQSYDTIMTSIYYHQSIPSYQVYTNYIPGKYKIYTCHVCCLGHPLADSAPTPWQAQGSMFGQLQDPTGYACPWSCCASADALQGTASSQAQLGQGGHALTKGAVLHCPLGLVGKAKEVSSHLTLTVWL